MSGSFADSNILLYLPDPADARADIATSLLAEGLSVSVQVLNEVASVMLGKWRAPWTDVDRVLAIVRRLATIHPIDLRTHDVGIGIAKRHELHIYDSMIVAAALLAGCDTLYSEDMHHGLVVEGQLTILNPFRA